MNVNRLYLRRKVKGKWVFVPMIVWEFSNQAMGNDGFEWYAIGPANARLDSSGVYIQDIEGDD